MKRPKYILQFRCFRGSQRMAFVSLSDVKKTILAWRPNKYQLWEVVEVKKATVDRRERWAK